MLRDDMVEGLLQEMDSAPLDGGAAPDDPTEFEVRMIKDAIAPALPIILGFIGLERLETRADIDQIAAAVRSRSSQSWRMRCGSCFVVTPTV